MTEQIAEHPHETWAEKLRSYEYPFDRTMMGFTLNTIYLIFPYWMTEIIVSLVSDLYSLGSDPKEEDTKFWNEIWLPELHKELKDVPISFEDTAILTFTFISYFIKIILAMCMQEYMIPFDLFWNSTGLEIFAWFQVIINKMASWTSYIP